MKRVLTIQDLSCVGKCSLTVALPILSACGLEACPLPTALLSNHTAFPDYTYKDLSEEMTGIVAMLDFLNLSFDTIYTGYLGSGSQIHQVKEICKKKRQEGARIIVDPAMGDDGNLYGNLDEIVVEEMKQLCGQAHIILPNLTEACLMTGYPYKEHFEKKDYEAILQATKKLGSDMVILTGVHLSKNKNGIYGIDCTTGRTFFYQRNQIGTSLPGTGDVFASSFVGGYRNGLSVEEAARFAVDMTIASLKETMKEPCWYGVNYEYLLPKYYKKIINMKQKNEK